LEPGRYLDFEKRGLDHPSDRSFGLLRNRANPFSENL